MKKRQRPPPPLMKKIYYDVKKSAGFGGAKKLGTDEATRAWLSSQPTYTLHKPVKYKFKTRKYLTSGANELWQMDLMEMIPYASVNKGYRYILTCVDVFSRYARALPIKTKSADDVRNALKTMLATLAPRSIQTDKGKEFYNSKVQNLFKAYNVNHYSVNSQFKAALVERFNRTLREKLNRYFTYHGHKVWWSVLSKFVNTYNNTPHSALDGLKPIDVANHNEFDLWWKQQQQQQPRSKLKLLEHVRISRMKGIFVRNFDQKWSEEVFQIVGIDKKQMPIMYVLQDLNGIPIEGKFYKEELQRVAKPAIFRIERILETRGKGKHKQYYVKWYGYDKKFNSWVSKLATPPPLITAADNV